MEIGRTTPQQALADARETEAIFGPEARTSRFSGDVAISVGEPTFADSNFTELASLIPEINIAPEAVAANREVAALNGAQSKGSVFAGGDYEVADSGAILSDAGGRPLTAAQRRDFLSANGARLQSELFRNHANQSDASRATMLGGFGDYAASSFPNREPGLLEPFADYLAESPRIGAAVQLTAATAGLVGIRLGAGPTLGADLVAAPLLADLAVNAGETLWFGERRPTGLQQLVGAAGGDDLAVGASGIYQGLVGFGAIGAGRPTRLTIPQGLDEARFSDLSTLVRSTAVERGLGDDIVVQGSRAAGTARVGSDIDIAIRLSPEKFDDFLANKSRLSNVNPGSAKERTLINARENGLIQAGEARLSPVRVRLEQNLKLSVDISVIRAGGPFDNGVQIPLRPKY